MPIRRRGVRLPRAAGGRERRKLNELVIDFQVGRGRRQMSNQKTKKTTAMFLGVKGVRKVAEDLLVDVTCCDWAVPFKENFAKASVRKLYALMQVDTIIL